MMIFGLIWLNNARLNIMITSKYRGHKIEFKDGAWVYSDTKILVSLDKERDCGKCNCQQTKEGHDHCLGTLKYAMNACCGHGETREAYIQFFNGFRISGLFAKAYIEIFKILNS